MLTVKKRFLLLIILISCNVYGQLSRECIDSINVYMDQKNTDKIIEFYNKINEALIKDSLNTYSHLQICDSLAILYYRKKEYKKAKFFYIQAKNIREIISGKQNQEYATACFDLANLYRAMEEYENAVPLYLEAKKVREKVLGKNNLAYAASCNYLGVIYYMMGEYEKAEPLTIEGKQIRQKILGKNNPDYAASCNNLAILYYLWGQYKKAEPLYLEALQIRSNVLGKYHPDYAATCNNLANFYNDIGFTEKAEPLYLEALQIRMNVLGKDHPDYAQSCNNLGTLYDETGQYDKAEALHEEARRIREKVLGKEHSDYAQSIINLAILNDEMGQYKKAELFYIEGRQIWERVLGKNHPDFAMSCDNLAVFYLNRGNYDQAKPLLIQAKEIRRKTLGIAHLDYAASCTNLAYCYFLEKQYAPAKLLYQEAMQIQKNILGTQSEDYAESCNNLALLYKDIKQYLNAEIFFKQAKNIRKNILGKLHPDYGLSCDDLAGLYWIMKQPVKAEIEFKESFSVNFHNLFSVFQFTNEKEKNYFTKNVLGEDDKAYSFYMSSKLKSEQPYSLSLFHRNLILSSSQALNKILFSNKDSLIRGKYNEWLNLKKYLSILYSKPTSETKDDIFKTEEKSNQIEKELARISFVFKSLEQNRMISWQTIQKNLKVDESAIEFAEFQYFDGKKYTDSNYYVALLIRKDNHEPEMIPLFEKKQLDSILTYKSTSAGQVQLSHFYRKSNHKEMKSLYDLIWKPIEQKLSGIKTIYFAPAGELYKIAFAALPVNNSEVLSDKYQLVQLNTTASVGDNPVTGISISDKIILYGGVQYDADSTGIRQAALKYSTNDVATHSLPEDLSRDGVGEFYYLAGSGNEVSTIDKLAKQNDYSTTVSDGMLANEESFKSLTGNNSPAILHIATHGFFFPDPKNEKKDDRTGGAIVFKQSDNPLIRSGLALAGANNAWKGKPVTGVEDGILTSYEVSNMYLPNTKLAVLSACETGLGDIQGSEGVYGLQRAFKMAGVENLIMSLWKVDDAATSEFMQEFYKNLFAKQTINTAFYKAQTIMKNKYRNDPYRWAAWVLIR